MPGPVPLVLLPAQQVRDTVPGQLHNRRRPQTAAEQGIIRRSHWPRIRNQVLPLRPRLPACGTASPRLQRVTRAAKLNARRPAHPGAVETSACRDGP